MNPQVYTYFDLDLEVRQYDTMTTKRKHCSNIYDVQNTEKNI